MRVPKALCSRYVYLGKERIQLAAGKTGESSCVYVQCDTPVTAAKQHRQVEARLWETAAAAAEMEEQEKAKAGITLSLLQGQWMELMEYLAREPDPEAPVRIIAWDFQQPVLQVLRQRGTLPAKARVGVCLLQAK